MTAQQAYGGGAKVALWAVAILLSAFLFVTHAWIRQGLILVQHRSIEGKPAFLDSAIQNELRPFIQWRLLALGVYGLAFIIGILPGGFVGVHWKQYRRNIHPSWTNPWSAIQYSYLTAAHIALCFGDRLVVLSHMAPTAALKHSANLAFKAKTPLLMLLIVGLALRIIGALFCGVGVPLAEILLDVSLTKNTMLLDKTSRPHHDPLLVVFGPRLSRRRCHLGKGGFCDPSQECRNDTVQLEGLQTQRQQRPTQPQNLAEMKQTAGPIDCAKPPQRRWIAGEQTISCHVLPQYPPSRRVVGSSRADSFMGTDFAIDDLARLSYAQTYHAEIKDQSLRRSSSHPPPKKKRDRQVSLHRLRTPRFFSTSILHRNGPGTYPNE